MSDRLEQDLEELLARRAASTEAELAAQRAPIADLPSVATTAAVLAGRPSCSSPSGSSPPPPGGSRGLVAGPPSQPSPAVVVSAAPAHAGDAASHRRPPPGRRRRGSATMVGMLECKWPVAPIGEAVGDAPIGGEVMDTPDEALAAFLAGDARAYATIPLEGYTRHGRRPAVDALRQPARGAAALR